MRHRKLEIIFFASCLLAIALVVALFSGCSCNYHLEKAYKKCGKSSISDTITLHDTIRVNKVTTDTVFNYHQADTVIVKEGRLTIKYFYHDSLVYLSGKCDTVFYPRIIKVPYTKTELKFDWWFFARKNIIWICIILFFLFGVYSIWRWYTK